MLKFLIVIGLVVLVANALVVLMVGVVMLVDWVRERQRVQRYP